VPGIERDFIAVSSIFYWQGNNPQTNQKNCIEDYKTIGSYCPCSFLPGTMQVISYLNLSGKYQNGIGC
jgi:hypothetical protein